MSKQDEIDDINSRIEKYVQDFMPLDPKKRQICGDAIINIIKENKLDVPLDVEEAYKKYISGNITLPEFTEVVANHDSLKKVLSKLE